MMKEHEDRRLYAANPRSATALTERRRYFEFEQYGTQDKNASTMYILTLVLWLKGLYDGVNEVDPKSISKLCRGCTPGRCSEVVTESRFMAWLSAKGQSNPTDSA